MKKQIGRVWIERRVDSDPGLSWIGEYSNSPKVDWAIDRAERGDQAVREFRYFNAAHSGEQTGNPNSPEEDYQRMEAYNRGDWWCVGVIAKAEVRMPSGVVQTIRSCGLWGIESDSAEEYFADVEKEELSGLREELTSLGFGPRAIAYAFRNVERRGV